MLAEIITIGDEILIGQIVDTNSAYISQELHKIGIQVSQITSIQDTKKHILDTLSEANKRSDLVILTGGLGPTKDDITKHTLCEYFDDNLAQNKAVLKTIVDLFEKHFNKQPNKLNIQQSYVPSKATVLQNKRGTACQCSYHSHHGHVSSSCSCCLLLLLCPSCNHHHSSVTTRCSSDGSDQGGHRD